MDVLGSHERRRLPRCILPGGVRPDEDPNSPPFEILDISEGGIRFETDRHLPQGHRLWFWFDYYVVEFRVQCEVSWSRLGRDGGWEHGARFVDTAPCELAILHMYVEDLQKALQEADLQAEGPARSR